MTEAPAPSTERVPGLGPVPTGNTYDKYGSTNPIERRLMNGFFAAWDALLPSAPPVTVLEAGVGEGEVSTRLAQRWPAAHIVGVDLPDPDLARRWSDAPFAAAFADTISLPFADDTFDLVLAIEVLEHVSDPSVALAEIARVARSDVVVSVPREPVWRVANLARGKYVAALGNTPGHVNHWSKRSFTSFVSATLDVTRVHTPFPWTMVAGSVRH